MPDPGGQSGYHEDSEGWLHSTVEEALEANLSIEKISGQYVTGGNCGQSVENLQSSGHGSSSGSNGSSDQSSGK